MFGGDGRLHWVVIFLHGSYGPNGKASQFWPGNQYVDALGVDGYCAQNASNSTVSTYPRRRSCLATH